MSLNPIVAQSTLRTYHTLIKRPLAYSLTELLIVIRLLGLTISGTLSKIPSLYYKLSAYITMYQLRQTINYARSLALMQQQKIQLCPSYNKYSCGGSWNQGMLVLSPEGGSRFFQSYINSKAFLTLTQSGYTNNMVVIQANGMTYTNGHFSYKSLKSTYISQFNLYFNRALRNYLFIGD